MRLRLCIDGGYRRLLFPIIFVSLAVIRSAAQVDPWEFEVYPYATTPRGVLEFETGNASVAKGHDIAGVGTSKGTFASQDMWYNSYEFTYGVTDRIEAALYLNMAEPKTGGFRWAGDKIRLRGRIFEEEALPVDIGWYLELEWHKTPQFDDAERELEFRPIFEKDIGSFSFMANPKFEKVIAGVGHNQGVEFGYVGGVYFRWTKRLSPGLESYGGSGLINHFNPLASQQHYLFPVVWGQLPNGIEYNLGVGFGLTRGSDHLILKVNFELERFVGAIFKGSSAGDWLH